MSQHPLSFLLRLNRPEIQRFLEKLQRQKEAKLNAQEGDNRPFIMKYVRAQHFSLHSPHALAVSLVEISTAHRHHLRSPERVHERRWRYWHWRWWTITSRLVLRSILRTCFVFRRCFSFSPNKQKVRTLETLVQTAWQMSERQSGHAQLIAKTSVRSSLSVVDELHCHNRLMFKDTSGNSPLANICSNISRTAR